MRDLILEEKTGFLSTLPFKIFDMSGQIFYSSEFTNKIANGQKLEFNLPAGQYKYDGSFVKLDNPVRTENIHLPLKERNIPHGRYEIVFGNNPNKCSIFYDKGIILFDNSFKKKPLYVRYTIYFHELGHHWYKTEGKADLYAAKKLLDLGFNPSQIQIALLESLTLPESFERKMNMVYKLTKNNG